MCREMKPQGHRGGKAPIEPGTPATIRPLQPNPEYLQRFLKPSRPTGEMSRRTSPPFPRIMGLGLTTPPDSGHFIESS
jgi:hypothetical protein